MQTARQPTVIDLFSGAGGTALGFRQAGFTILAAVEKDRNAAETYRRNIGVMPVVKPIEEIDPHEFMRELGLAPYKLDVLIGCPPCQGFTRMRNDAGKGDARNGLVAIYGEFVRVFKPRFAMFENVPGLIRTEHGKQYYRALQDQLRGAGYCIRAWELDAADFGVPQHRRRVILIAGRDGEIPPDLSAARTHGAPDSPEVRAGVLKPWRTVRDAIACFPPLQPGEGCGDVPNHVARRLGERVARFIAAVPTDGGSRTDVEHGLWLECHRRHGGHKDVYGRLAWDRPANVITSGCTNVSKGRFAHPEQNRGLTPREAAALQGFPDDFVFVGSFESVSAQIGNAVPPPMAKAAADLLAARLREEPLAIIADVREYKPVTLIGG